MGLSIDDIELCLIHPDMDDGSSNVDELVQLFNSKFDAFDVNDAQCFDPVQRDQLLGIIGTSNGHV